MSKPISAQELAALLGNLPLKGKTDTVVTGVASLKDASPADVSFLANRKYEEQLQASKALVFLVPDEFDGVPAPGQTFIVSKQPDADFDKVVLHFAPAPIQYLPGIHPTAVIAPDAKIGQMVHIGPHVVIDQGAEIGDGTIILAGTWIGAYSKIGRGGMIYANVSIRERITIGDGVIIHSGVVIGADGYGFRPSPQGIAKIPQVGTVQIGHLVEIGSNAAIDRARFGKTIIGNMVKIDNLVHVAHNVRIGDGCFLIGQCGVAGSSELGRGVVVAAQSGVRDHVTLGDGAQVAAKSGVAKSVAPGQTVLGTPAESQKEFLERHSLPRKVKKLEEKLKALQSELQQLKTAK